jgi:NADPH:quinone reductase-like Zn-dependent oxidoreductase
MLPLVRDGRLKPLIDAVFPFDQLPQAVERMKADTHVGKIAITLDR